VVVIIHCMTLAEYLGRDETGRTGVRRPDQVG